MKAIFEVDFNLSNMIDNGSLENDFNGDALKFMQWLYNEEGFGIFHELPKLIKVIL
jgi:hypothetical protein